VSVSKSYRHRNQLDFTIRELCTCLIPDLIAILPPPEKNFAIIGGGWNSVVLALNLAAKRGRSVTIVSRSPIENRSSPISGDDWYDPVKRSELTSLPWEKRGQPLPSYQSSTIPFFEMRQFREAISTGRVRAITSSVRLFNLSSAKLNLEIETGSLGELDQIIFATGLRRILDSAILDSAKNGDLPLDSDDRPVLTDHLEWGEGSKVYISGHDAAPVVGPFADRISGGKIAAKIIAEHLLKA
jgi:hypothetical protein